MKIFLSALNHIASDAIIERGIKMKWNLMSYYQIRKDRKLFDKIYANSDEIMIDSGAHSFQFGAKVDVDAYTEEYCSFIKEVDSSKIVGFFEMDVDNIIGLKKVKELRAKLDKVSDKIIPVWHYNRGADDYVRMCQEYRGKVVSITGFANKDIKDEQYIMFLKTAWENDCRVHCLGMTREKVLKKVPFDYVDSSSWLQYCVYGQVWNPIKGKYMRPTKESSRVNRSESYVLNYQHAMDIQNQYYNYWRRYNNHYKS